MIDNSPGGATYSDLDVEEIDAIPVTNPHRPVDTTIVAADKEGSLLSPCTQFGAFTDSPTTAL